MNHKRVLLIGPYSETGGVSVHLKRLKQLLHEEYKFTVINESRKPVSGEKILNLRSKQILKYFSCILNASIVHIHSGSSILRIVHLLVCFVFNKKSIITFHSYRNPSKWQNWLYNRFSNKLVAVNDLIKNSLGSEKTIQLNAFIPPELSSEPNLPDSLQNVLSKKKSIGKKIISANAFRLVSYNGKDLYGIDQLIDVARVFKRNRKEFFIIFVIGSLIKGEEKYSNYLDEIKREGLSEYILLYNKSISFVKLITNSDLIIRPTLTDGDALTIREALLLNKPVIASDVVIRPRGTVIYKSNDLSDLYNKIVAELEKKERIKKEIDTFDYKKIYSKIYNE